MHAQSCPTFATPWTIAYQALLSMEFSKQEYWNGLPFPPPGDLPDPGIKPASPAVAGGFLPLNHLESPQLLLLLLKRLPAMQETWAQSLGHEDPLEKEMATHSSILA